VSRAKGFEVLLLIGIAALILMAFVFVRIRSKSKETERISSFKPTLGSAPATAVRCEELSDIESFTRKFKCGCGGYPFRPEALLNQETLVYDGERLATFKLKCHTCGRAADLYFVKPVTREPAGQSLDPA